MKISKTANDIFLNNINILTILKSKKRDDSTVIALMLCEVHFTSKIKRGIEYLVWIFLTVINSHYRHEVSVGIGQIKIKHWVSHNYIHNKLKMRSLIQFQSVISNYDLILKILSEMGDRPVDYSKILAHYRGETRSYHLQLFIELKRILTLKSC